VFTVLVKLFAFTKLRVTLPPVPNAETVSLYTVGATEPVTINLFNPASNNRFCSTLPLPFGKYVITPLSVVPLKFKKPDEPEVPPVPLTPDVPDEPEVPDVPLLPK
jgi:hypothetical protein